MDKEKNGETTNKALREILSTLTPEEQWEVILLVRDVLHISIDEILRKVA